MTQTKNGHVPAAATLGKLEPPARLRRDPPRALGRRSSSVPATTGWRAPPTWPARASRCSCSKPASESAAPARSTKSGRAIASRPVPTSRACCTRSSSTSSDGRLRIPLDPRHGRHVRALRRRHEHPALGRRRALRRRDREARARRPERLASFQRREAPAARRASALRPGRPLDRPRPEPRRDRRAVWETTTKLARCSSSGRWSNTSSIS